VNPKNMYVSRLIVFFLISVHILVKFLSNVSSSSV
jgi:hypothetical protein